MHTLEHLFATFVRNSEHEEHIVYFGPMGCRTGFYFLTRGMTHEQAITLTQQALAFVSAYEGTIPGSSKEECGNYLEHDLSAARRYAAHLAAAIADWTVDDLVYPAK